jgi:hypothetical protein
MPLKPKILVCVKCGRRMIKLEMARRGMVITTREEMSRGIGSAEECQECGRVHCEGCSAAEAPNSCVCGRGRDSVKVVDGVVYYGPVRLIKVQNLKK